MPASLAEQLANLISKRTSLEQTIVMMVDNVVVTTSLRQELQKVVAEIATLKATPPPPPVGGPTLEEPPPPPAPPAKKQNTENVMYHRGAPVQTDLPGGQELHGGAVHATLPSVRLQADSRVLWQVY